MINRFLSGFEKQETESLFEHAFAICRDLQIHRLLIQLNKNSDFMNIAKRRNEERIAWVTMDDHVLPPEFVKSDILIHVPKSPLTRISQLRVGLFLSVTQGFMEPEKSVVALSGEYASGRLDTLMILNPKRDFPWYQRQAKAFAKIGLPGHVLERAIHCALRLSSEGREGRAIGLMLLIGKLEELKPYTHQLILNPLEGHPKKARNIDNPEFFETLREFSALDGAIIIEPNGTVESAGTYLGAHSSASLRLDPGLGARHAAAAAITHRCKSAIAVVVSESSGTVSVMQGGAIVLKLEKVPPVTHQPKT